MGCLLYTSIKLDRVSYRETETTQEIPYESTQEETGELDLGDTQVKTAGENGARTIVTREKLVNGQVVELSLIHISGDHSIGG